MKITLFGCPLEAASIPRAPVPAKTSMIKLEFNLSINDKFDNLFVFFIKLLILYSNKFISSIIIK